MVGDRSGKQTQNGGHVMIYRIDEQRSLIQLNFKIPETCT